MERDTPATYPKGTKMSQTLTPTLGEIAKVFLQFKINGVTRGSMEYVLCQVYFDEPTTLPTPPHKTQANERDTLSDLVSEARSAFWAPEGSEKRAGHINRCRSLVRSLGGEG